MSDKNKKKILVIEDDPHIVKVFMIKLKQEGFEPTIAGDGETGLQKIIETKPDLIMMDLMLPKKDGFWVMEEMKKNPEISKIPVIVLSNLGQEQDRERATSLGAKEYVIKSDVPISEVLDRVKKYLGTV